MKDLSIHSLHHPIEESNPHLMSWIPVLVYHKVDYCFELGITHVSPCQFEKQMKYLYREGYQTISFQQYLHDPILPADQKYVIITFDDAYQSVYKNAFPIMRRYNFKATVFVISDFVGRRNIWDVNLGGFKFSHLNWFELYQLVKAGWEIGSHTATHPDLLACSDAELEYEIVRSKQILERCTGSDVSIMAYPFGRYDQRTIDLVQEAGYSAACTMNFGHNGHFNNPFLLSRQAVHLWDRRIDLRAKLKSTRFTEFQRLRQKGINFCSRGTVIIKNLRKKYLQFK